DLHMEYTKYHKLELTEVLGINLVKGKGKQKKDKTFKEQATRNWLDIPSDIMINILQRVNVIEIVRNVQKVCTKWRQICKDPFLWRVIYLDDNFYYDHPPNTWPSISPLSAMAFHKNCKNVVDRSQGQLVGITIVGFCDDELLQCVAERSSQLRRLEIARCMYDFFYHLPKALKKFPLLEELSLHFKQFPEGAIKH
ncbi:F-box domain containing protein, partial [Tanacetum coccineum]